MSLIHHDRVLETSITTGTGNLLLSGAQPGYYSFFASFGAGVALGYSIWNPVTGENEVGTGQIVNSSGIYYLQRNTVERSSNGNALVNFTTGKKLIANVLLATEADQLANLANCILATGTVPFAANQSMGGYKLTNLEDATAATDAVNLETADALITAAEASLTTTIEAWVTAQGYGTGNGNVSTTDPTTLHTVPYWSNTAGALAADSPIVVHQSDDGSDGKVETQTATFVQFTTATDGATVTFNFDQADKQQVTLGGNRTLAYTAGSLNKGQRIYVRLVQDVTGGRAVTWWSGINWNNGQKPILDPTPGGIDVIELECSSVDSYGNATCDEVARSTSAPRKGITTAVDGATITFNIDVSPVQQVVLGGNRTLAIAGTMAVGRLFMVKLIQDGTGSRTVTWWSGITWAGGVPTLSTTAAEYDWFGFVVTGSNTFDAFIIGQGL